MHRLITAIGFISAAGAAAAEPVSLTGDALKTTVTGATVELDTPAGTIIPVRFGADGYVTGEARELAGFLGAAKDRGRWWIDGDQLCSKWFRWFDAKPHCIRVSQDGARIHWVRDDGEEGTGTLVAQAGPADTKTVDVRLVAAQTAAEPKEEPKAKSVTPLPPPTYALGAEPVADEQIPVEPITAAPLNPAQPENPQSTVTANQALPPRDASVAKEEPAPLRFAGAAGFGTVQAPASEEKDLQAVFDPRHRKPTAAKPDPQPTQAVAQTPARTTGTPTAVAPSAPVQTAALPDADRRVDPAAAARARAGWMPPSMPSFRVAGVVQGDVLNVRSGPSEYHPPVGALPPAARGVQIVGACRDYWCPIRRGRLAGWVNRLYLAEDMPMAGAARGTPYRDR